MICKTRIEWIRNGVLCKRHPIFLLRSLLTLLLKVINEPSCSLNRKTASKSYVFFPVEVNAMVQLTTSFDNSVANT
ncbi:MAG: hypothetical protein R2779_01720 [Crocinitomicaceae bacterium]